MWKTVYTDTDHEFKVRPLKSVGNFDIDKVTEKNGEIYYDVYDREQNLVNTLRTAKDARTWAKMMSE